MGAKRSGFGALVMIASCAAVVTDKQIYLIGLTSERDLRSSRENIRTGGVGEGVEKMQDNFVEGEG